MTDKVLAQIAKTVLDAKVESPFVQDLLCIRLLREAGLSTSQLPALQEEIEAN